jgi:hypothetical protein
MKRYLYVFHSHKRVPLLMRPYRMYNKEEGKPQEDVAAHL